MTIPSSLRWAALAVLSSLALTAGAFAQTTATWIGGNVSNNYFVTTNWDTSVVPDAIDSRAVFTNASSALWTNTTNTLGSILASGGNVVLGNPTNSISNGLILDVSAGKPIISNSSTLFMYADLQGNEGFTKLGSGDLTFRFNSRNLTYTGDIDLLGGQLSVNQASSLGNVNNRLLVGSNSTFAVANGANTGNFNFESTRTFVVTNGVTFSIRTTTNAISAIFSNSIIGTGTNTNGARIDFQNISAASVSEATANRYTLAGTSNNWIGRTTIQLGAKLTLATGTVISTNELNFSSGSGTWAGIDLGGNTQSVGNLGIGGSSTTARTFVISNGILRVTNPPAAFTFSGANGTLVDVSNSTGFVFDGAGTGRNFIVRPDVSAAGVDVTNTMVLATAGVGSNTITANDIIVGTASATNASMGTNHLAVLLLGKTNNFYANQLLIGGFNGAGAVQYAGGLSTPSTVIRGSNGVAAMNNLIIGETSSGVRPGSGVLDLSAGTADALVTNMVVGRHTAGANNNEVSSFNMGGGSLTAASLQIAFKTNSGTPTMTDTFTQGGGTVAISNISLGNGAGTGAATLLATYNLSSSNAVLKAQTIQAGSGTNFSASTRRKINFGAGRIETYDTSTDLVIQGIDTTLQGRLEIAVASNAQTKTFFADTGRKITLEPSAVLTFDGGITKDGAGTLVLKSANVHNGNTTVAAGTLDLQTNGSLRFQIGGSGTNNQLNGAGTASLDGQFVFNLASASTDTNSTWTIVSNSLTTTYGPNFLVTGFSGAGGNWTNTTNGVNYVFAQSNGVLSVQSTGGVTPYNAWVTYWTNAVPTFTNTAGTDNPDGDPFDNNEEFAFDGNPTVGSPALLTAVKVGPNAVFNYVALTNTNAVTYAVQFTTNLTSAWTPASVTISNSLNQSNISQTNSYLRKEFTVPATAAEFYRVQATILP
jgi:fibronectin-binding autotransporter adhesin